MCVLQRAAVFLATRTLLLAQHVFSWIGTSGWSHPNRKSIPNMRNSAIPFIPTLKNIFCQVFFPALTGRAQGGHGAPWGRWVDPQENFQPRDLLIGGWLPCHVPLISGLAGEVSPSPSPLTAEGSKCSYCAPCVSTKARAPSL